jgi:NADH-quinone oxidoreductase subunit G
MSDTSTTEASETPVAAPKTTVSVEIDGRVHEAQPGQLVIDACGDAGVHVPHFCYHPRMRPVGMCRQCLVEVEGPRGPMMVVSCMTPVAEGQVVRTATDGVKRAQEGVIELLLANHPLDCPVCDKGGECPLQDQAMSHGPGESRYVEEKRHYEKPIPISDLVHLDRERCILCDRCTRFADEVAGDPLISFTHRGNNTQVLTFPDEPFSSYFSGNTVQICPVGALTAAPYRFKARPWDLEETESTCTTCSVGCRVSVQSSRDHVVRVQGVDSDPVNWGWLCDRGRFSFEALSSPDRLGTPLVRTPEGLTETSWSQALATAARFIQDAIDEAGPDAVAVLGGARSTNEGAHAWALLSQALGVERHDPRLDDALPLEVLELPQATIDEAATARTIVLLAPDLKEELPVLHLRLRDAAEKRRSRILEVTPRATGLTASAWQRLVAIPGRQAAVVAEALQQNDVAAQLASGDVVVVVGRGNLAEHPGHVLGAVAEVLRAAPHAKILPVLRRGNVRGALAAGLAPSPGHDTRSVLLDAAAGKIGCLVLVGADPLADVPDVDLAHRALEGARRVIAVDTFLSASAAASDVVLAACAFAEQDGTTTNLEGRVTKVAQRVNPPGTARADWAIAVDLAEGLGHDLGVVSIDDVQSSLGRRPFFNGVFRRLAEQPDGVLIARGAAGPEVLAEHLVAVTPERNSYDHRLVVGRRLYDRAVGTQMSPSLAPLAEGPCVHLNPRDLEQLGVRAGGSVRLVGRRASVELPAVADPAVARGIAWVPFNQVSDTRDTADVRRLIDTADVGAADPGADGGVVDVRLESV